MSRVQNPNRDSRRQTTGDSSEREALRSNFAEALRRKRSRDNKNWQYKTRNRFTYGFPKGMDNRTQGESE